MDPLTDKEIQILKVILQHCKSSYTRGFKCVCGKVSDEDFMMHDSDAKNRFGSLVCRNCGENGRWRDVKINKISIDIRKVRDLTIIEEV